MIPPAWAIGAVAQAAGASSASGWAAVAIAAAVAAVSALLGMLRLSVIFSIRWTRLEDKVDALSSDQATFRSEQQRTQAVFRREVRTDLRAVFSRISWLEGRRDR